VTGDVTDPASLHPVAAEFDWVVNCVAAGGGEVAEYRRVYLDGTRHLLDWLRSCPLRRYVYTSSTGVYGQNDGSEVDETSPAEPASPTGRILVETEQLLQQAAQARGFPAVILRLSGIYGPGRGYWLRQFLAGEAQLEGEGSRVLNMIHRDDVVGAILAALEHGQDGEIYNASDDEPVTQRALFEWLARHTGRPFPPSLPRAAGPPPATRRGATNKRVLNRKLRRALGYRFRFPTFREGFAAELEARG
jgi:nucleoside-diphosphate-sugar epimerase